jgi:ParB family chromosome partitioning protein
LQQPRSISIDSPNTFQPRGRIDDARLDDWRSITANGVISLSSSKAGDRFQIIAGERRWRAAQWAGLLRVPVVVKEVGVGQEESLWDGPSKISSARISTDRRSTGIQAASDEFHHTQEKIAAAVGRSSVRRQLSPVKLPEDVRAGSQREPCRWGMPEHRWPAWRQTSDSWPATWSRAAIGARN